VFSCLEFLLAKSLLVFTAELCLVRIPVVTKENSSCLAAFVCSDVLDTVFLLVLDAC
jgi:hypothetical protein